MNTTANLKDTTINMITSAIWRTEHMNVNDRTCAVSQHGYAQGAIQTAYDLGIITQREYNMYWDENNAAHFAHPSTLKANGLQ